MKEISGISELRQIVENNLVKEFGSIEKADASLLKEAKKSQNQFAERNYGGVVVRRMYNRPSVWSSFTVSVRGVGVEKKFTISHKYLNRPNAYDYQDCLFQ